MLPILLVLGACSTKFGPDVPITVIFQEPEQISIDYAEQYGRRGALGYAELFDSGCRIYVPKPRDPTDLERWKIMYHEFRHCWEGSFHR